MLLSPKKHRVQELCDIVQELCDIVQELCDIVQELCDIVQELCESRGGCPGLLYLINLRFLWT